jgi:PadR family transcriptional regulator PadR
VIGGKNMIPSQMLKGTLEGCILAIISKQETYGYGIVEQLAEYGFGKIAEGTIYPLLLRLEKNKMITARYKQSEIGPKRKYYSLTSLGMEELQNFTVNYIKLSQAVSNLLDDMKGDDANE